MGQDNEFYERLGLPRTATEQEIRKAYRHLAMKYHPDRNTEADAAERFKAISEAYEVLSDAEKRRLYDRYGKEGLSARGGPGMDPMELFERLFSDGFFASSQRRRQRCEDFLYVVPMTLEELYAGGRKRVSFARAVVCTDCRGSGMMGGRQPPTCTDCGGRGVQIRARQIGPNIVQQVQVSCPGCSGKGVMFSPSDYCQTCHAEKTVRKRASIEITIEPGTPDRQRLEFAGEGDQFPDMESGSVVIQIKAKRHTTFRRSGKDLLLHHDMTVGEAICGFSFRVRHLAPRRTLLVRSDPGDTFQTGEIRVIPGQGMPILKSSPQRFGDLYIVFNVILPKPREIEPKALAALAAILPKMERAAVETIPGDEEVVAPMSSEPIVQDRNKDASEGYDEDADEEVEGGRRGRAGRGDGAGGARAQQDNTLQCAQC